MTQGYFLLFVRDSINPNTPVKFFCLVAMHCVSPMIHGLIVKVDQPSKNLTLVVCHSRSLHGLTVNSELRAMVMAVQQVLAEFITIFSICNLY